MTENEIFSLIDKAMKGQASRDELSQLKQWAESADENRRQLAEIKGLLTLLEADQPMSDMELNQQRERLRLRLAQQRRPRLNVRLWQRAAAILAFVLIAGGGLQIWNRYTADKTSDTQMSWVEQRGQVELTLSDGQRIDLTVTDRLPSSTTTEQGIVHSENGLDYSEVTTESTSETLFNQVATLTGSTYHLTLSDGTKVWLNACSDLRFPVNFDGRERRVYLHGEAYFEVAKNTEKPFLVSIHPGIDVKVYGTQFDVDCYDINHVRTSLLEGSVGIIDNERNTEHRLKPNETALLNALNGSIEIAPCDAADYTQWREGLLTFYDEPLSQLMTRFCRLHDIEVNYQDDSVRKVLLSGMLHDSDNTDTLLETLQTVSGLTFERHGNRVTISQP